MPGREPQFRNRPQEKLEQSFAHILEEAHSTADLERPHGESRQVQTEREADPSPLGICLY